MPIYLYHCRECGHRFELLRAMSEKDSDVECPECGTKQPERLMPPFFSNNLRGQGGASRIG
jgi:putative FmdB family regulatory protein